MDFLSHNRLEGRSRTARDGPDLPAERIERVRCNALADAVIERHGVDDASFVTDDPRLQHREHRVAQLICGDSVGVFTLLDQHEDLQVTRRASPCKRTGCCAVNHHRAQTDRDETPSYRQCRWALVHGLSPERLRPALWYSRPASTRCSARTANRSATKQNDCVPIKLN